MLHVSELAAEADQRPHHRQCREPAHGDGACNDERDQTEVRSGDSGSVGGFGIGRRIRVRSADSDSGAVDGFGFGCSRRIRVLGGFGLRPGFGLRRGLGSVASSFRACRHRSRPSDVPRACRAGTTGSRPRQVRHEPTLLVACEATADRGELDVCRLRIMGEIASERHELRLVGGSSPCRGTARATRAAASGEIAGGSFQRVSRRFRLGLRNHPQDYAHAVSRSRSLA